MKNKKLFAILTLVCFLLTLMPVAAMAEGESVEVIANDDVVAKIGTTTYSSLQYAIDNAVKGDEIVFVKAGNYDLPSAVDGKEITFNGANQEVTLNLETNHYARNSVLTFKNVTIKAHEPANSNDWQKATLAHNAKASFVGCKFVNPLVTFGDVVIENCEFVTENSAAYNLYLYGGTIWNIKNSTFSCEGKSVLIYAESHANGGQATFEGCGFTADQKAIGKAAIEIDSSLIKDKYIVTINNCTTTGFDAGSKSGNPLYNLKNGELGKNAEIIVPAVSVELNQSAAAVVVGGTVELEAEVTAYTTDTLTWESDNTEVATVENGIVTTKTVGTATITAKAGDATATCEVTVNPISYTVTFNTNGGSAVDAQSVTSGALAIEPNPAPTKEGFAFDGWFTDEACTAAYDFNAAVTTDTALYAKWTEKAVEPAPSVPPVSYPPVVDVPVSGGGSSTSTSTPKVETETTVTPSGTKVETTTETKSDGTKVETTTTTTASGETTKVETTTETNKEGTKVETTVTTDSKGETSTTVTATLDNGSAVTNNDKAVEVEVTKVEEKVVETVQEAVKADETVNVVGDADNAVSVSATNASTGAAQTDFVQPMSVNVPVDNTVLNNVEDTSKLTLAKVVTNEDGTTELVYMGGSYDEETGTFNAKVDEDGDYILVEKADLVKIELTIDDTTVKHNDKHQELDVAPAINAEAGRTELPLRYLGEALGFGIDWNNNVVTITKGDISFSLTIGEEIPGYGTPYLDSDRTMVSARYISEMLGANVIWDPVERQVIVVK